MLERAKDKPWFFFLIVGIIVLVPIFMIFRGPPRYHHVGDRVFAGNIQEAIGYLAAEEADKALGGRGGKVALIFGGKSEEEFQGTEWDAYQRGFKTAMKKYPSMQWAGHFLSWKPLEENGRKVPLVLTYKTLRVVRDQFGDAKVLVSFVGLPRFLEDEESLWKYSSPPKMVAVETMRWAYPELGPMCESANAYSLLWRKADYPKFEPSGEPHQIFNQLYSIFRPSDPPEPSVVYHK